jgi:DNA-binding CsgD family transcriptional regulator/tetratricopeptide (TPR) repeat protein
VLLVIEDGHWADAPTLLLLRHLARGGASARLLLLGTFRDTEADVPETLSDTLADLRRSEDVVRLRLTGLSAEDVMDFLCRAGGGNTGPELANAIEELTDGNPFLVCELWRTLVETGGVEVEGGAIRLTRPLSELGSPESVREVVSQRLSRLSPKTNDLLDLAATAGADFDLDVLRRAARVEEPELASALDEAVRSGMVEEIPTRGLAYRFTHELVRRAIYDRLSGIRRAEMHLALGEALAADEERSGRALADLAYHFAAAAPFGGAERAIEYNRRAAHAAADALAFDEAAARLRTAIDLGIESPAERAQAYVDLGTASHRAGKAIDATEAFAAAADVARASGNPELLAKAAIGYEEACWRPTFIDRGAVELLEEAAAALGEKSSQLRVGVLGALARALDLRGDHDRAAVVRTSAVDMARLLGDSEGLATVLMRAYWARGTSSLEEILGWLTEARDLAAEIGNTEVHADAMAWRVPTFVALCDLDSARREVDLLFEKAEATGQPFMIHVALHYRSTIALCDGDLAEAEAKAQQSYEWSRLLTGRDASGVYGIQMFSIRREQGRLAEVAPLIRILAGESREGPWRPGLVSVLAELGMEEEARRELAQVAEQGLDQFRDSIWLATLAYLTDAAAALGDEQVAALVYPELQQVDGDNVMIGHLVECYGAVDRYRGMLAATLGEWDRAEGHFERAMELNARMGARTWLAHTAYEYARMLLAHGQTNGARAGTLLGQAATLAEDIGMHALLSRIRAIGPAAPAAAPAGLSSREVEIVRLVARGLSNREIGKELYISEHTAANHIRSILRKTGCANRTEAASYAHRHGLIDP